MFRWHLGVSDEGAMYQQDLFDFSINDDQLPKLSRLGHCQKRTSCFSLFFKRTIQVVFLGRFTVVSSFVWIDEEFLSPFAVVSKAQRG